MWFNKDGHFDKSVKLTEEVSSMSEKRRQYTDEFKREAVRLVTEQGYGVTEAARNLGINGRMLDRWKRQAQKQTNGHIGSTE